MSQDQEHLKLLTIFHYVAAAVTALFSMFPIFHLIFGLLFVFAPEKFESKGSAPGASRPEFFGWIFVIVAGTMITMGLALAASMFFTGRNLARRRHHTACLVVAGLECLLMPYGTALGVFTIVVLTRDSVKQLFAAEAGILASDEISRTDEVE